MKRRREDRPDGEFAELAALADGSLAPERRAELDARVAASSELAERLGEQQRAVALAQSATNGVEAPAALRGHIEAQRRARRSRRPRHLVLVGAAATTAVAVAVGVVVFGSGTSSKRFQAALAATDLQPGARIELNATGLPRLADGRFYEVWLRDSAGVLVPLGTFNQGPKVTLWAGVSPTSFTTLTVTRERADGDQASSGEKVLSGRVDTGS